MPPARRDWKRHKQCRWHWNFPEHLPLRSSDWSATNRGLGNFSWGSVLTSSAHVVREDFGGRDHEICSAKQRRLEKSLEQSMLKVCISLKSLRVTRHNTCDNDVQTYGMHGTANCRTIAIMHRHRDTQISIDRILYTQDSEQKVPGDRETTRCIQKVPVMTRALALPASQ